MLRALLVLQDLVDADRTLDTLRDQLTRARVRCSDELGSGRHVKAEYQPVRELERRVEALRTRLYGADGDRLDDELRACIKQAAALLEVPGAAAG